MAARSERARVLLVDDHAIVRAAVRLVLEDAGGMIVDGEAGCAEDALAAVRRRPPDLVLMDLRMPGLGGIEGTFAVKQLAPRTRVLVLSMLDDDAAVRGAFAAGADGHVSKAAPAAHLVRVVRHVLAGERYAAPPLVELLLRPAPGGPLDGLTQRERLVARLAALGHTDAEIGARVGAGSRGVARVRAVAMGKLGVRTRAELVGVVRDAGMLRPDAD